MGREEVTQRRVDDLGCCTSADSCQFEQPYITSGVKLTKTKLRLELIVCLEETANSDKRRKESIGGLPSLKPAYI